jgi:hypothetical protein
LFNFNVRHILKIKHIIVNGLSRRPKTKSNNNNEKNKIDIDDFIDIKLAFINIRPIKARIIFKLNDNYSLRSQMIAKWLITLKRLIKLKNMTRREWFAFKKKILRFRVMNRYLFRNNTKNMSFRKIINSIK